MIQCFLIEEISIRLILTRTLYTIKQTSSQRTQLALLAQNVFMMDEKHPLLLA